MIRAEDGGGPGGGRAGSAANSQPRWAGIIRRCGTVVENNEPPGHELSPQVEGGRPMSPPPKSLEQSIAETTRQMRHARGFTLSELANRVGVSRQMLSKIEKEQPA